MKYLPILLFASLLFSCSPDSREEATAHKKVLTLADLKFPFIDELNGIPFFPKPNNENIVNNHIDTLLTEGIVIDASACPGRTKTNYSPSDEKMKERLLGKFRHRWFIAEIRTFDTAGNLSKYGSFTVDRLSWKFSYNKNGFVTDWEGGSCIYRHFKYVYYFDTINNCLHQVTIDKNQFNYYHLNYYLSVQSRTYQFDKLGYLLKLTEQEQSHDSINGYLKEYYFTYNSSHKIESIWHQYYEHKGSYNLNKLITDPDRIPNNSLSHYFYSSGRLDSIVTRSTFYSEPNLVRTRSTYYGSGGIPIRTVYKKGLTHFFTDGLLYSYSKRKQSQNE